MDRAEVEKKVAEKLGFKIRGQSGCYILLTGRLPDKLLSDNSPSVKLWNALIDSELRRAEARELLKEIVNNTRSGYDVLASDAVDRAADFLNQEEENRG